MPVGAGVGGHPHVIAVGSKGEKSDARRLTLPMAQTHVTPKSLHHYRLFTFLLKHRVFGARVVLSFWPKPSRPTAVNPYSVKYLLQVAALC
jgi:hypothetical protein